MKFGYILTTDQSDAGNLGIFSQRTNPAGDGAAGAPAGPADGAQPAAHAAANGRRGDAHVPAPAHGDRLPATYDL
eukprot:3238422-Pyramimonas_sp.AAC.1